MLLLPILGYYLLSFLPRLCCRASCTPPVWLPPINDRRFPLTAAAQSRHVSSLQCVCGLRFRSYRFRTLLRLYCAAADRPV